MAILLDNRSKVLLLGASNPLGMTQVREMIRYGTQIVGVVESEPAAIAGQIPEGIPVFGRIDDAASRTGAGVCMVFTPPMETRPAVEHSFDAGIGTVICFSEGLPLHDVLAMQSAARHHDGILIGPGSSGVYSPSLAKAGFFCRELCIPGRVGIVTKGGSVAYAVMSEMKSAGLGVSTVVSVGGGAVKGIGLLETLELFAADLGTDAIVLLGEVGGSDEEEAAAFIATHLGKPVVAMISGRSAPPGKTLGHAGVIAARGHGSYASKSHELEQAGARVVGDIGELVRSLGRLCRDSRPPAPVNDSY